MKTKIILLLFLLFYISSISSIDLISERVGGYNINLFLVAFDDLHLQEFNGKKIAEPTFTITITDKRENIIDQHTKKVKIELPVEFDLLHSFYPYFWVYENIDSAYKIHFYLSTSSTDKPQKNEYMINRKLKKKEYGNVYLFNSYNSIPVMNLNKTFNKKDTQGLELFQWIGNLPSESYLLINKGYVDSVSIKPDNKLFLGIDNMDKDINSITLIHKSNGDSFNKTIHLFTLFQAFQEKYSPKDQLLQLSGLVDNATYNKIKRFKGHKLQEAINSIWLNNDPSPETEENELQHTLYERVIFADDNFTIKGYRAGWKTDRGKIYLKYGEPDEILKDNFPIGKPPVIVWYYYSEDKTFTFYDNKGYGNYELYRQN